VIRRCLAFPLDAAIIGLAWLLATLWIMILHGLTATHPASLRGLALSAGASLSLGVALNAVYFVGFIGACGQTPAKMLLDVRVVRRDGAPVGYGRALIRWLGYGLVAATLGVGLIVLALNPERRGLQDLIAGTRVIRAAD
jgi:uncharacterized RDD family membrane protein YckC